VFQKNKVFVFLTKRPQNVFINNIHQANLFSIPAKIQKDSDSAFIAVSHKILIFVPENMKQQK